MPFDALEEFRYDGPKGRLYHSLGAFIVRMSAADHLLSQVILAMISPSDNILTMALPVVSGMDFKVKLAIIRRLAVFHGASGASEIMHATNTLQDMFERRNKLAHWLPWESRTLDELCFQDMRLNTDAEPESPIHISLQTLSGWHDKIGQASRELREALDKSGYGWRKPQPSHELDPMTATWKQEIRELLRSRSEPPSVQTPEAPPPSEQG